MHMCRVFRNPDGTLRIMHPNLRYWNKDSESLEECCKRICDKDTFKDSELAELPFVDVEITSLPTDRSRRHAWRWADNPGVYVDETVPDPPHPKQDQLDRIEKARTVDEIKSILKEMVK